jgi:hypothetical protein
MFPSVLIASWLFTTSLLPGFSEPTQTGIQPQAESRLYVKSSEAGRVIVSAADLDFLGAAQLDLVFPPGTIEQPQVVAGELLSNALLESNLISEGRLRIAFVSSEPLGGTGELLKLEFQSPTSSSPVAWKLENARGWRSSDSSEISINLSAPPPATPVVEPVDSSKPTGIQPVVSESAQPVPGQSGMTLMLPELPSPLVIRVELPGWLYFAWGGFSVLVVGLLVCLLLKKQ